MSTSADTLVEDYLDRLERELADFPAGRRRELVQEISEHITEARAELGTETEADIRNLLDASATRPRLPERQGWLPGRSLPHARGAAAGTSLP